MTEPEFNAYYQCTYCHALRPKSEIIIVDDKPICSYGTCKDKYYETTKPKPWRKG